MKILLLTHRFNPDMGGIEINSELLGDEFSRMGHEVRVLTWSTGRSERAFPYQVLRSPTLLQLFQSIAWCDLVFHNNPCYRLGWPNLFFQKPSVVALCTYLMRADGHRSMRDRIKARMLDHADGVIAVSRALAKHSYPRATVIGNPFRSAFLSDLGGERPELSFAFLGRLVSEKGCDLAISALSKLAQQLPDRGMLHLSVIGDGPERKNLETMATKTPENIKVTFTGILRDSALNAALNRHRYLLVTTKTKEAFGNVALEAMACGCIPVVAQLDGLPDAIGEAGLTFEPGNVDSLCHTLMTLIEQPEVAQQLKLKAPAHLAMHEPSAISRAYISYFTVCMNRRN